jgi:hypothetical protein
MRMSLAAVPRSMEPVKGTLPGDPSLPFSFGGESGSNGSFSRSVETTIAPAFAPATTIKTPQP